MASNSKFKINKPFLHYKESQTYSVEELGGIHNVKVYTIIGLVEEIKKKPKQDKETEE
jgi:hypothetical protein